MNDDSQCSAGEAAQWSPEERRLRERDGGEDERALWETQRASGQGDVNGDPLFALTEADGLYV